MTASFPLWVLSESNGGRIPKIRTSGAMSGGPIREEGKMV